MRNLVLVNLRHWLHNRRVWALAGIPVVTGIVNAFGTYREDTPECWRFFGALYAWSVIISLFGVCAACVLCINQKEVRRNQVIAGYKKAHIFLAELIPALCFAVFAALCQLPAMLWCLPVVRALDAQTLLGAMLGMVGAYCIFAAFSVVTALNLHRNAAAILIPILLISGFSYSNSLAESLERPKYYQSIIAIDDDPKTEEKRPWIAVQPNEMYLGEPQREIKEQTYLLLPHSPLTAAANYLKTGWLPNNNEWAVEHRNEILEQRSFWENVCGVMPAVSLSWLIVLTTFGTACFRQKDLN